MSSDDTKLILEHFDDKFATLLENIDTLVDNKLKPIKEDISELKADMKTVKAAVTETSVQVQDHEERITILEQQPV